MGKAIDSREELLKELIDIPEEFIPSLLEHVKVFKKAFINVNIYVLVVVLLLSIDKIFN